MDVIDKNDPLSQSKNIVADNVDKLKELFPDAFTEGKIDFDALQEILGKHVETEAERYQFTWNGKAEARREAQKTSTGTLRPCKKESVNFDDTQNLFIEGDNLEVLKLLQKGYNNKVKMIYIDPPYNTGKDFVYKDNYHDNLKNYKEITGQTDTEGNRLTTNSDTNGRFHSIWLKMIYSRLKLARNLLKKDGVVFISIDDNEVANLRKICDEIYGEENFVAEMVWQSKSGGGHDEKCIVKESEYVIVYSKQKSITTFGRRRIENNNYRLSDMHKKDRGQYLLNKLDRMMRGEHYSEALNYSIIAPDGSEIWPGNKKCKTGDWNWRWSKTKVEWGLKNDFLEIKKGQNGNWAVYSKQYERMDHNGNPVTRDYPYRNVILSSEYNTTQGGNELQNLFKANIFDYAKPSKFIANILKMGALKENDLILDFFSGSSTTAHAVMQLNSEDNGNRRYIMIQLPEKCNEKSEAYKAGYRNICEIGKERIRRVVKKIREDESEKAKEMDLGFKVLKLDSSNIQTWDPDTADLDRSLWESVDNIKNDRTEEDVLYEILIKYGLELTVPIEEHEIAGNKVFNVGYGALFICLSDDITIEVAEGIGKLKEEIQPETCHVVFKDTGFKDDVIKTNAMQVLKRFGVNEVRSI